MNNHKFWDKIAKKYEKSKIQDMASYEIKLKKTQEYFTKEMFVTEVACGTGMTAVIHAPYVKSIVATDISPAMIEIAKRRAEQAGITNISFEVSDILSLSIDDESQDIILAMSIFHLLENPEECIQALYKKLKPGGLLISSTICLGDKMNFLKPLVILMRLVGYAPSIVHFFKRDQLVAMIENSSFVIEHEWQPSPKKAVFIIAKK